MTNHRKPIKIIFDATPMLVNKTGIAYYTERLAVQLAKAYPDDVELVGFYYNFLGRRDSSHLPRLKNLRYTKSTFIPSKIIYQLRRFGIEIPIELLTLERGDFLLFPNFISHPSLFRTPQAPVIHDLTFHDLPEYVAPKLRRDLQRFVPRDVKKRASFVITVSEFTKQRIIDEYGLPPDDIIVTPIPPNDPPQLDQDVIQKVLKGFDIQKPFILFLGTIEPRKNIINLIEAYKLLPKKIRAQYPLVLAGGPSRLAHAELQAVQTARQQEFNIKYLGYVSDQQREALYQSASLFVHASYYEGFGMPILEAMRHGIPCALSDIPVFKEVGGNAAHYFDPARPQDIAHALQQIINDRTNRSTLLQASKKRVSRFSWTTNAKNLFTKIQQTIQS